MDPIYIQETSLWKTLEAGDREVFKRMRKSGCIRKKRTSGLKLFRLCNIFGMAEAMPLSTTEFFGILCKAVFLRMFSASTSRYKTATSPYLRSTTAKPDHCIFN
jgi:hypothetical protein